MFGHPEFDLFEAMYTTRAMRRLKPDPVPRAIIMRVIEAATMSPSNSNRQPWIFVVVTEDPVKQAVAKYYKQAWYTYYLTTQKRQVMEQAPETAEAKSLRSATYLADHMHEAPVLIFACVKKYTDKRREGQPMHGSIYPAVQNLCLAARAYGLGTSITGLHQQFEDEIDKLIGVPAAYKNEVLIPLGYPKGRWGRPVRKAAADVTFFNKWGSRE
ncbi:MAG TPA: nitroreductase family protein [Candidatus Binataceae bacterium]|nr:nitroreductase family protein [Candidatus Binataceae bacterium]